MTNSVSVITNRALGLRCHEKKSCSIWTGIRTVFESRLWLVLWKHNWVDLAVVIHKVDLQALGDVVRQVREVLPVLSWQDDAGYTGTTGLTGTRTRTFGSHSGWKQHTETITGIKQTYFCSDSRHTTIHTNISKTRGVFTLKKRICPQGRISNSLCPSGCTVAPPCPQWHRCPPKAWGGGYIGYVHITSRYNKIIFTKL